MKSLKYEEVVELKIFWSLRRLEAGLNGFRIKRVHYDKFGLQIIREPPYYIKPNKAFLLPSLKTRRQPPPLIFLHLLRSSSLSPPPSPPPESRQRTAAPSRGGSGAASPSLTEFAPSLFLTTFTHSSFHFSLLNWRSPLPPSFLRFSGEPWWEQRRTVVGKASLFFGDFRRESGESGGFRRNEVAINSGEILFSIVPLYSCDFHWLWEVWSWILGFWAQSSN